ncbi:IS110 family transposase [Nocardia takedensis]
MDTSIPERPIFVGVDTHADTHHVAVVNEHGKKLTDREFPTTATGYAQIEQWLQTLWLIRESCCSTSADTPKRWP